MDERHICCLEVSYHNAITQIGELEIRLDITKSMLTEALKRISELEGELEEYQLGDE